MDRNTSFYGFPSATEGAFWSVYICPNTQKSVQVTHVTDDQKRLRKPKGVMPVVVETWRQSLRFGLDNLELVTHRCILLEMVKRLLQVSQQYLFFMARSVCFGKG